mgnify:CR=1 FL=1
MIKIFIGSIALASILFSADLQNEGVEITYTDANDMEKTMLVIRNKPSECKSVKFDPKVVYGENGQASDSVSENCKKAFVTYMGKISPIKFSPKVETYGEVEVLQFIEDAKNNKNMLLIDSRTENWFYNGTIPSAVNIPYLYTKKSQYPDEFNETLETLGVKIVNEKYDFTNAKTILLFCNGAWCGQSPEAMKDLVAIGYPEEKLKWYRGGMQSWLSLGMSVIKP